MKTSLARGTEVEMGGGEMGDYTKVSGHARRGAGSESLTALVVWPSCGEMVVRSDRWDGVGVDRPTRGKGCAGVCWTQLDIIVVSAWQIPLLTKP